MSASSHQFSIKFPPRNRVEGVEDDLQVGIEHAEGILRVDQMGLVLLAMAERGDAVERVAPQLKAASGLFDDEGRLRVSLSGLKAVPGLVSDISGRPALRYHDEDVVAALTSDEITRLARHELEPHEFFALAERYGVWYQLHDDFYEEASGQCLQPMRER